MKRLSAWRERLVDFCFPAESDTWLAVLRIGLGVQVVLYALSLRDDWSYLLAGTGHGLISRNLGEAILSLESRDSTLHCVDLFTRCRLRSSYGSCLSVFCNSGLVSSPLRG